MQFQPGNTMAQGGARPGAGRKPAARLREFDEVLEEVLTLDCRKAILEKIAESARQGDLKAAAFLFSHAYGRPTARIEPPEEETAEEPTGDMTVLTDEELDVFIRLLHKVYGTESDPNGPPSCLETDTD